MVKVLNLSSSLIVRLDADDLAKRSDVVGPTDRMYPTGDKGGFA